MASQMRTIRIDRHTEEYLVQTVFFYIDDVLKFSTHYNPAGVARKPCLSTWGGANTIEAEWLAVFKIPADTPSTSWAVTREYKPFVAHALVSVWMMADKSLGEISAAAVAAVSVGRLCNSIPISPSAITAVSLAHARFSERIYFDNRQTVAFDTGSTEWTIGESVTGQVTVIEFSSGSSEIVAGETLTGGSSGETAVVISVTLESGSWAGGNASGTISVTDPSGSFTDGEALNGSLAGADAATAGGEISVVTFSGILGDYNVTSGTWGGGDATGAAEFYSIIGEIVGDMVLSGSSGGAAVALGDLSSLGPETVTWMVQQGIDDIYPTAEIVLNGVEAITDCADYKDVELTAEDHLGTSRYLFFGFVPDSGVESDSSMDTTKVTAFGYEWYLANQRLPEGRLSSLSWDETDEKVVYEEPDVLVREFLGGSDWSRTTGLYPAYLQAVSGWGASIPVKGWAWDRSTTKFQAILDMMLYLDYVFSVKRSVTGLREAIFCPYSAVDANLGLSDVVFSETSDQSAWEGDSAGPISGTVEFAASTAVVGSGTSFSTELSAGDYIFNSSDDTNSSAAEIASITDDTHLTLVEAYGGTTGSGKNAKTTMVYADGDVVSYGGSLYTALVSSVNVVPSSDPNKWEESEDSNASSMKVWVDRPGSSKFNRVRVWGERNFRVLNFKDGTIEFTEDGTILDGGTGATATMIGAATVVSGSWAGNDAAGTILISYDRTGSFCDGHTITCPSPQAGSATMVGNDQPYETYDVYYSYKEDPGVVTGDRPREFTEKVDPEIDSASLIDARRDDLYDYWCSLDNNVYRAILDQRCDLRLWQRIKINGYDAIPENWMRITHIKYENTVGHGMTVTITMQNEEYLEASRRIRRSGVNTEFQSIKALIQEMMEKYFRMEFGDALKVQGKAVTIETDGEVVAVARTP
jgi:hypothetical protein